MGVEHTTFRLEVRRPSPLGHNKMSDLKLNCYLFTDEVVFVTIGQYKTCVCTSFWR